MTRLQFWVTYLVMIITCALLGGALSIFVSTVEEAILLGQLVGITISIPVTFAAMWFRLKDAGYSRHWLWFYIFPLVSLIPFLISGFAPTKSPQEAA